MIMQWIKQLDHQFKIVTTVQCPKRQMSVLNGKSIFFSCFPTNRYEILSDDRLWEIFVHTKFY